MNMMTIVEREMTNAEVDRMKAGFAEHSAAHGNPPNPSVRYGFVALTEEKFAGCSSGLTNDNGRWFYLSDLFVEEPLRRQGYGAALLRKLEQKVASLGAQRIWTWTAGFEAPVFYKKQGYEVFCEMEDWYPSGHGRVGLWKRLRQMEPV